MPLMWLRGSSAVPFLHKLVQGSERAYCVVWGNAVPNVVSGSEQLLWLEMDAEEGTGLPASGGATCGPGTDALIASPHPVE